MGRGEGKRKKSIYSSYLQQLKKCKYGFFFSFIFFYLFFLLFCQTFIFSFSLGNIPREKNTFSLVSFLVDIFSNRQHSRYSTILHFCQRAREKQLAGKVRKESSKGSTKSIFIISAFVRRILVPKRRAGKWDFQSYMGVCLEEEIITFSRIL